MPFFRFPFLYNPNYYNSYVNYRRNNLNNGVLPNSYNVNDFNQNNYKENSINQNDYKENSVNPNYYNSYVNYRRNNLNNELNNRVLPKSSNVNNFSSNNYNENSINQNNYNENSVNQNNFSSSNYNENGVNQNDYNENRTNKKNNSKSNNDNYFFELFGLKLYFDDVLLICLIFFLYDEGVRDNELFISLILLLLS